jgi:hypothetical protein
MTQEALELHSRYVHLRAKHAELQQKLEQMRDILAKADERRAREKFEPARWNPIIGNLETSYNQLKAEIVRTRTSLQETEQELSRALEATGQSLSSVDTGPRCEALPPIADLRTLDTTVRLAAETTDGLTISLDQPVGWRDVLHMSLEILATLTEDEITQVRAFVTNARKGTITDVDRRLVEGRLQLASQLRELAPETAEAPEGGHRRRQIVLRAAIDKIQHNRAQQLIEEEVRAVLICQQRLARLPNPTMPEKRLLRILDAALNVLRRHKAKTEG